MSDYNFSGQRLSHRLASARTSKLIHNKWLNARWLQRLMTAGSPGFINCPTAAFTVRQAASFCFWWMTECPRGNLAWNKCRHPHSKQLLRLTLEVYLWYAQVQRGICRKLSVRLNKNRQRHTFTHTNKVHGKLLHISAASHPEFESSGSPQVSLLIIFYILSYFMCSLSIFLI